jgi:hypothetical protein
MKGRCVGSNVATAKKAPVTTKSSLRINRAPWGRGLVVIDVGVLLKEFRTKVNDKGNLQRSSKWHARTVNERYLERPSHFCDKYGKKRANKFGTLVAQKGTALLSEED